MLERIVYNLVQVLVVVGFAPLVEGVVSWLKENQWAVITIAIKTLLIPYIVSYEVYRMREIGRFRCFSLLSLLSSLTPSPIRP